MNIPDIAEPQQHTLRNILDSIQSVDGDRAILLTGSIARGCSDKYSDIDLLIVAESGENIKQVTDAISSRILANFADVIYHAARYDETSSLQNFVVTPWVRFDISVVARSHVADYEFSTLLPIHDPHGVAREAGPDIARAARTDAVTSVTEEFFRVCGLLPVVIGRQDLVAAASGAGLARDLLLRLLLEGDRREPPHGALRLRDQLSTASYETLFQLPPIEATEASVTASHQACAAAFIPAAKRLYARLDCEWPAALEGGLAMHWKSALGVELPR